MKNDKVDYQKLVQELTTYSSSFFEGISANLKRYRELIVPNPTEDDLQQFLIQQYPTYQTEPQFIHVPRDYFLEYLNLLVKFELPDYCRSPKWAYSLFDLAIAEDSVEGVKILLAHGFQLNTETKKTLCQIIFDNIFDGAVQSECLPDLTIVQELLETEVFKGFNFYAEEILDPYYRKIFAQTDMNYSFEKHLQQVVHSKISHSSLILG